MSSPDSWMLGAIFFGPIVAVVISVVITLWHQNRKQRLDSQERLFRTLMAHRKLALPPLEAVNALNLIDVEFANNRRVVELWHEYYNLICQPQVNWGSAYHAYLDLLSAIAKSLGYRELSQTDIDKVYNPQGYAELFDLDWKTRIELLRVLENTARIVVDKKIDELPSSSSPP